MLPVSELGGVDVLELGAVCCFANVRRRKSKHLAALSVFVGPVGPVKPVGPSSLPGLASLLDLSSL